MIQLIVAVTAAVSGATTLCSVSGTVVDEKGHPIPGAAVYLEQGLEGSILQTQAGGDGAYRFDDVYPGVVGVFARRTGYAWGGASVTLGLGQSIAGVNLRLREPASLSGHATTGKDRPVRGVRVTRVALLTESPVSIPFTKLRGMGVSEPVTNSSGEYKVDDLPQGASVALKFAHSSFAQARIDEAKVGSRSADVTMYEGVLVTGQVLAASTQRPVAQAVVSIRNANPPHDTAIVVTDIQGNFGLRLLPGAYMYKAGGARFGSAGWQSLLLTGQLPLKQLVLNVGGTGQVTGKVMDAKTGDPIEGARIYLSTEGAPAAMARTGPTGDYELDAMAGENTVQLEPAPGYLPPTTGGTRFTVKEGERFDLPTFWLAPLPRYVLKVVGTDDKPVPGAVVRLLRPAQVGWQTAGDDGVAQLSLLNLPDDGRVVGLVEHPQKDEAALFSITRENAEDAVVQLFPVAHLTGRVVGDDGRPLEGAVVDGRLLDESFTDPILIWRAVTNREGEYEAPIVPAQVAQIIAAYTVDQWGAVDKQADAKTVVVPPEETKRVDDIVITGAEPGRSLLGKRLKWTNGRLLCGPEPPGNREAGAAIVQYCGVAEAEATIASLETAAGILGDRYDYAVIVDGEARCNAQRVHVLSGEAPGTASTYVLDSDGEVALETFGPPPLRALR